MKPSKKEQVEQRRANVLLLSSFGLSQQEISDKLITTGLKGISQRNISRDLEWLDRHSVEYVKRNKKEMTLEYQKAIASLYYLKKKAKERFDKAEQEGNDKLMIDYGRIIIETTNDIMNYMSIGNMIDAELIKEAKEDAFNVEEKMKRIVVTADNNYDFEHNSQAKF